MEAYLDWQKKTSGIKLNDVIEEYRYVAAGQTVKKGDFLTYVQAVLGEETKEGNIFPTSWTQETIYKYNSSNGYVLEADNVSSSYPLNNACDGNDNSYFRTNTGQLTYTVRIKCPQPTKITKMKTRISASSSSSFSAKIYGTKDVITTYTGSEDWVLLHTISALQSSLTEISLENSDYYLNYRIVIGTTSSSSISIYEWQTSEYIEKLYEQQVTPAIEPPFDAVALSSGVGAPEFVEQEVEVTKTDNLFGDKTWTQESIYKYVADDGTIITSSGNYENTNSLVNEAFDGSTSTNWNSNQISTASSEVYIIVELPEEKCITKMKLVISNFYSTLYLQGSNDSNVWKNLYSSSENHSNGATVTCELNNDAKYKYYRLCVTDFTNLSSTYARITVFEWQVLEYKTTEIQQIPSTEHNEQVKIARVYKEVEVEKTVEGNIFPTSGWNEEVLGTKYSTNDGYIITASSYGNSTVVGTTYYASKAFDGDVSTSWHGKSETVEGLVSLDIQLPKEVKITKMKLYTHATGTDDLVLTTIKGSKNSTAWVDLYSIEGKISPLTEIELSNTDFYKYYKIDIIPENKTGCVAEWQTSEYIEKVTEVIQ